MAETAGAPTNEVAKANIGKPPRKIPLINWQKPMVAVLIACVPCMMSAIYRFGWRSAALVAVTAIAAFWAEWIFTRTRKEPVTSAVFVTAGLMALTLPPTLPFWMAAIGAVVAIMFGKELFGGFGRNVFNPALVGRCFIYICFPVAMTGRWAQPAHGLPGGFALWATETIDVVTGATPLDKFKHGTIIPYLNFLAGERSGCLGETMAIAILIGGVYLLVRRVADYRLMLWTLIGAGVFDGILWSAGVSRAADPLWTLLAGGLLFGAVFMTTDPVSASRTPYGRVITGLMVGILTVVIRCFGIFSEGVMFAILLVNSFAPAIDMAVRTLNSKKQKAVAA